MLVGKERHSSNRLGAARLLALAAACLLSVACKPTILGPSFEVGGEASPSPTATATAVPTPVARSLSISTIADMPKAITLSATAASGQSIASYSIVSNPTHGTLTGTAPNLVYTAAMMFTGSDSFTYVASDGTGVSTAATVSITIESFCAGSRLTASPYAAGSGSTDDPYRICTSAQLARIGSRTQDWGASFRLGATIDLTGVSWTPIGSASTAFTGSFDGEGNDVSNLALSMGSSDDVGFFGVIGSAASVHDLVLTSLSVVGRDRVGALAGSNAGTITTVRATGPLSGAGDVSGANQVGGLIGQNTGNVTDAHTDVSVQASNATCSSQNGGSGGLVGYHWTGAISRSSAAGPVVSTITIGCGCIGGLVGFADGNASQSPSIYPTATISRSYATGSATSGGAVVGGLVGWSQAIITDSYATGNASGGAAGAGACAVTSTQAFVGGLVGTHVFDSSVIQRTYATGAVHSTDIYVGGLTGLTLSNAVASDSFSTGAVSGGGTFGGVTGEIYGGTYSNIYWDIFTTGLSTGDSVGAPTGTAGVDTSIPANAGYFFDPANAPLSSWDFTNVWRANTGAYPTLR